MGCEVSRDDEEQSRASVMKPTERARTVRKNLKINAKRGQTDKIFENVTMLKGQALSHVNELNIMDLLKHHFFFYGMSSSQRSEIISKMVACKIQKDQYIFKQGDPASSFFIIDEGKVDVEINGKRMKSLTEGDYFGELALIYMAPRSASIKAVCQTHCWCITRGVFRQTVEEFVKKNYKIAKTYLTSVNLLAFLTDRQKDSIAYNMLNLKYQDREVIFKQNDDANSFFIVTEGTVEVFSKKNGIAAVIYKVGESFGEESFKDSQVRLTNAMAKGKTKCLSIGRDVAKGILGDKIQNLVNYNIMKNAMDSSQVLSKFGKVEVEKLLQGCRFKNYSEGEVVFKKGDSPSFFGSDKKSKDIAGEQYILNNIQKIPKQVIKKQAGLVGIITFEDLVKVTNRKINQITTYVPASYEKKMEVVGKTPLNTAHIQLENLLYIKKLGQGQFGKVYLVQQSKDSKKLYAIKCIRKDQVIQNTMQNMIVQEKRILEMINFPMMLNFVKSFKDSVHIYFLLEYIKGSELFNVIREIGILKKSIGRFYLSSLILSIEYLNMKNIIYRDLKPQNVMVESDGYLRLIDMGTAKQLKQSKGFRTFTIIGTPHYMAPEVMQGKGYTFAVDMWSIGVVFYELVCGSLPFAEDLQDPYEIHSVIMKDTLKFPAFFEDAKAKRLMDQFLNRIPELRLPKGFAALKASPYFDGFNWDQLYDKKMKSPFISKIKQSENMTSQGKTLLSVLYTEKSKTEKFPESKIPNWDKQF